MLREIGNFLHTTWRYPFEMTLTVYRIYQYKYTIAAPHTCSAKKTHVDCVDTQFVSRLNGLNEWKHESATQLTTKTVAFGVVHTQPSPSTWKWQPWLYAATQQLFRNVKVKSFFFFFSIFINMAENTWLVALADTSSVFGSDQSAFEQTTIITLF